jgi:hypothetical protein
MSPENEVVADTMDVGFYTNVIVQDDWTRARLSFSMKDVVRVSWRQIMSDLPTIYYRVIFEYQPLAMVLQVGFVGTVPQNMSCSVDDRLLIHTLATSPEHEYYVQNGQKIATWVASTGWLQYQGNLVSSIEMVRLSPDSRGADWKMCSPIDSYGMPLLGTFRTPS